MSEPAYLTVRARTFDVVVEYDEYGCPPESMSYSWDEAEWLWRKLKQLCDDRRVAQAQAARGAQPEDL